MRCLPPKSWRLSWGKAGTTFVRRWQGRISGIRHRDVRMHPGAHCGRRAALKAVVLSALCQVSTCRLREGFFRTAATPAAVRRFWYQVWLIGHLVDFRGAREAWLETRDRDEGTVPRRRGLQYVGRWLGHPAERVNTNSKALCHSGDDGIQHVPVRSTAEQHFAMVTAKNDMVASTRNVQSRRSWHPCRSEFGERQSMAIDFF